MATATTRAFVSLIALGLFATACAGEGGGVSATSDGPAAAIEGVEFFDDLGRGHVDGDVDYPQVPPVGGDHFAEWTPCSFYETQPENVRAVHSMEHGAVWITFDPALPADQVEVLRALAGTDTHLLVTPFEGLPTPVVASTWGMQLKLDSATDPRLAEFVTDYLENGTPPEPGAPC